MADTEVLIAGGGIIGLSAALELAGHGLRVAVLERGKAMQEASWAAAGMLAATDPENPPALQALAELSIRRYPAFLQRVEQLSGLRVPLRTAKTLQYTHEGEQLWLEEHSFDPRDLCAALPAAVRAAGVELIEETEVLRVTVDGGGVVAETARGSFSAAKFISCCGAWLPPLGTLPVFPVKGQMATVRLPDGVVLDHVIRTPELYLVPRGDGRVVIGATVEHGGFDKSVERSAIQRMLASATRLWPAMAAAEIVETWAGLRPASEDGLPILGECVGEFANRCWAAAGHFRNGILLAPATAHLIGQLLRGEKPDVDIAAFRCDRFAVANVH